MFVFNELLNALEFGFKQCEKGNNLEQAIFEFKKIISPNNKEKYLCSVCGVVPVDAENGFDTCESCVRRI